MEVSTPTKRMMHIFFGVDSGYLQQRLLIILLNANLDFDDSDSVATFVMALLLTLMIAHFQAN